ncbi:MAG TPA: hypothetical protein VFE46_08035 [Pirellulales bacterium]|nr:hypothetical protein [Pirellulales bacterium]
MATRRKSTSLKRRFAWTLASAATIGLVSVASIFMYHAKQPAEQQEPGLLAAVDAQAIDGDSASSTAPAAKFDVVPAVALEEASGNPRAADKQYTVAPTSAVFVEQTPGAFPAGNFHSPRYGYSVTLNGTGWTRWDDLAQVVSAAEWGALLGNYGRFLVMPVTLADASASAETIDRTLLAQFGFQYPNLRGTDLEVFQRQGAQGHVFRIAREISGRENVYRIWILRRDRNAYLVAAWIDLTAALSAKLPVNPKLATGLMGSESQFDAEIDAQLDDVLNRFKLDDLAAVNVPSALGDRHLLRRASHSHTSPAVIEN